MSNDQAIENEIQAKPDSGLLLHQKRVIDERNVLRDRLGKLQAFFGAEEYSFLDGDEQTRLQRQVFPMNAYLEILNERIGAFTA